MSDKTPLRLSITKYWLGLTVTAAVEWQEIQNDSGCYTHVRALHSAFNLSICLFSIAFGCIGLRMRTPYIQLARPAMHCRSTVRRNQWAVARPVEAARSVLIVSRRVHVRCTSCIQTWRRASEWDGLDSRVPGARRLSARSALAHTDADRQTDKHR